MKKANRIFCYDWEKYDQGSVVYQPKNMTPEELRLGHISAYESFYSSTSLLRRFPWSGKRHRLQWTIYNMFMRKGSKTTRITSVPEASRPPELAPVPPIMPKKREWREAVLEAVGNEPGLS
jgi:hypothetical protein